MLAMLKGVPDGVLVNTLEKNVQRATDRKGRRHARIVRSEDCPSDLASPQLAARCSARSA